VQLAPRRLGARCPSLHRVPVYLRPRRAALVDALTGFGWFRGPLRALVKRMIAARSGGICCLSGQVVLNVRLADVFASCSESALQPRAERVRYPVEAVEHGTAS